MNLDGDEKCISVEHRQLWTVPFDPSVSYGYHRGCYSKFTNKRNIDRAQECKSRVEKTLHVSFFSRLRGVGCSMNSLVRWAEVMFHPCLFVCRISQ